MSAAVITNNNNRRPSSMPEIGSVSIPPMTSDVFDGDTEISPKPASSALSEYALIMRQRWLAQKKLEEQEETTDNDQDQTNLSANPGEESTAVLDHHERENKDECDKVIKEIIRENQVEEEVLEQEYQKMAQEVQQAAELSSGHQHIPEGMNLKHMMMNNDHHHTSDAVVNNSYEEEITTTTQQLPPPIPDYVDCMLSPEEVYQMQQYRLHKKSNSFKKRLKRWLSFKL